MVSSGEERATRPLLFCSVSRNELLFTCVVPKIIYKKNILTAFNHPAIVNPTIANYIKKMQQLFSYYIAMRLQIVCLKLYVPLHLNTVCSRQRKEMLGTTANISGLTFKRATTHSNLFPLFFYCKNLGNKAKDSVGTGEFYCLSNTLS